MAATDFPVGHTLAVKLWSKRIAREALKQTFAMKFAGEGSNNMIQIFDDTSKGPGDQIRWPLRVQPTGRGVTGSQSLEGNEEAIVTYADTFVIEELAHAFRAKTTIDAQRVAFDVREECRMSASDWLADRLDTWAANQLTGYTVQSDTIYTGNNTVTAPSTGTGTSRRAIAWNNSGNASHTAEASLSSNDTFAPTLIDMCVNIAKTTSPLIRPIKVGSSDYYVMFLHPDQVRSLRSAAVGNGSWFDIQKAALTGGEIENNPIFTGALGVHNGVVLHEWSRLPPAVSSGANVANTRRAVFCGAQAAALAYGQGTSDAPKYIEDTFDFKRQFGVSVQTIAGLKKSIFNSTDFATIVAATYAAAP